MFQLLPINGHSMNIGSAEINFDLIKRRKEKKKGCATKGGCLICL
jgi:hypothetical protein